MSRCKRSFKSHYTFWRFRITMKEIHNKVIKSMSEHLSSPETSSMARFFGCALDRKPGTTIPGNPFTFRWEDNK